jgi:hypothetical protein
VQVDDVESRLKEKKEKKVMFEAKLEQVRFWSDVIATSQMTQGADHRQARAVDQTANTAVELNVVQIELGGGNLLQAGD